MFTDPITLIDQTIDNLETLAAVFADDIDERTLNPDSSPSTHISRSAYMKIGALLPALRAARIAQEVQHFGQRSHCINCE